MKIIYFCTFFNAFLGLGLGITSQASTPSSRFSEELYSDALYSDRSTAEIPQSFESSGRGTASLETTTISAESENQAPLESLAELDAPVKKKGKKSSRN